MDTYDVVVVGAGIGGIYAVQRFTRQGLSVLGLEGAGGVGGVWYHNRYPGARVDLDSLDFCYYFSQELLDRWRWSERYASQPELLEYLNLVADMYDVKRHFRFGTWMTGAQWHSDTCTYEISTSIGETSRARFLVMATGNLSLARRPPFPGLERFKGEWVQTSHWPERDVQLHGRRIGIVGTGSSGVQAIPVLAEHAEHLWVFQRTANYVVPARNAPLAPEPQDAIATRRLQERRRLLDHPGGAARVPIGTRPRTDYSDVERRQLMERQWELGGQGMNSVFSDQGIDKETNDLVSEFVRERVRTVVKNPVLGEKLCPSVYPIGTRRLALDTGYYQTFNRDNVTLVDVRADPIVEITESGIRTGSAHHELDLIVFALGFEAFTGAIDQAHIRNEQGESPTDGWTRGPRTLLGLMTAGFPNLFTPTGPGSPSVLANLMINNEFSIDWIADVIAYMDAHGTATIEPSEAAQEQWTKHVADVGKNLLRRQIDNYMVHVNADDDSRVFIPYVGGFPRYVEAANAVAEKDYKGFVFGANGGRVRLRAEALERACR